MSVIGINPTVDFAFKLMLGSPDHARVTVHFLNAILGNQTRITSVEFLNPFLGKDRGDDKLSILDILATDNHGRQLNIEIQTTIPLGILQRLAYYDARLFVDQIKDGEKYHQLRPAIVICVLTKPLFSQRTELHSDFRLRDAAGNIFSDDLQIHTLELTKLNVTRENLTNATSAERWAYFLSNAEIMTETEIRELFAEPEFEEAAGVLEMINQSPEQLQEYRARKKFQMDEIARLDYAREEGLQKGELLGQIGILQSILGISEPIREHLLSYDLSQLKDLSQKLQQLLNQRGN